MASSRRIGARSPCSWEASTPRRRAAPPYQRKPGQGRSRPRVPVAFSRAQKWRRRRSRVDRAPDCSTQQVSVRFRLICPPHVKAAYFVVGSVKELGDWSAEHAKCGRKKETEGGGAASPRPPRQPRLRRRGSTASSSCCPSAPPPARQTSRPLIIILVCTAPAGPWSTRRAAGGARSTSSPGRSSSLSSSSARAGTSRGRTGRTGK